MAFTFIHAADLHLGAPFRSISAAFQNRPGRVREELQKATFTALERLVEVCLQAGADVLVLAGDVYNVAESSLTARFALRDAFARLGEGGVRVFVAHGNHDPLPEKPSPVPWPENVFVFGKEPASHDVKTKSGDVLAICGISHATGKETANLALRLKRKPDGPRFQMGVLHCALTGKSEGHSLYAPCSLKDLAATGLDYIALGHVHGLQVLGLHGGEPRHPYAAYPGSMQGLHRNEPGLKGCLLVRVDDSGKASPLLVPLAPVIWEDLRVDLTGRPVEDLLDLAALCLEEMEGLGRKLRDNCLQAARDAGLDEALCEPRAFIFSLELCGAASLDAELRKPGTLEAFLERLREQASARGAWVRKIRLLTRPGRDRMIDIQRQDLVGEVVRLAEAARSEGPLGETARDEASQVLGELFARPRFMRARGVTLASPDEQELKELLREAEIRCLNLLEKE